jgi:hypothetical protein
MDSRCVLAAWHSGGRRSRRLAAEPQGAVAHPASRRPRETMRSAVACMISSSMLGPKQFQLQPGGELGVGVGVGVRPLTGAGDGDTVLTVWPHRSQLTCCSRAWVAGPGHC